MRRTRRQILDATVDLMTTRGIEGLTMDAVAEAADVSRSTLYRHWSQLPDLLADGVQHLGDEVLAGTPGAVEADTFEQCVHAKARAVGRALRDDRWRTLIATLGVAAEADAEAAAVHERWVAMSRGGVADYVRQCRVADGLDPAWVSDLVLGPIYLNAVMLHDPWTDVQVESHVARTLALLAERASGGRTGA